MDAQARASGSARVICDIYNPDGTPFDGCPRTTLKRVIARAAERGFVMNAGPEAEFFLFQMRDGDATTDTHDAGGYFDLTPVDQGEDVRRQIILALEAMGFEVEAAHHEVAPGQHEIDFRYADVLTTADNISTFRFIVKNVAPHERPARDLHAETHLRPERLGHAHAPVALHRTGPTRSVDPAGPWELSETCLHYIGGLLQHAKGFCAITNPLVNSYKRLVPGLRGPDQHRVVAEEPEPAHPRARGRAAWRRASSCGCPTRRATRTSRWR